MPVSARNGVLFITCLMGSNFLWRVRRQERTQPKGSTHIEFSIKHRHSATRPGCSIGRSLEVPGRREAIAPVVLVLLDWRDHIPSSALDHWRSTGVPPQTPWCLEHEVHSSILGSASNDACQSASNAPTRDYPCNGELKATVVLNTGNWPARTDTDLHKKLLPIRHEL